MSEVKPAFCKCSWPASMRHDVNYCVYCTKVIPVRPEEMTATQLEMRTTLETVGLRWPKESAG